MPRFKPQDPLNLLLASAMKAQAKQVAVTVQPVAASPILRQCERPQWRETRLIALVHRASSGRETYLGVFQELKSDLFSARRLVPSDKTAHGSLPREVVTQDYWLHPKVHVAAADSEAEVRAIEARFKELLREFG